MGGWVRTWLSGWAGAYACVCVCVCVCVCACTRMCVCACVGVSPFIPGLSVEPVWPHWRPWVGSLPIGEAHGAGQGCVPVFSAMCTLGQNLARCPRTTLEVGWWLRGFRWANSTVLVQRARHCHVALCVLCVLGLLQLVVLAAARQPPRPTQFGDFPRKDALDAQLPPPAFRHSQFGNRSHDLSVARPTLSPVELTRDPCVCVCACVRGITVFTRSSRLDLYGHTASSGRVAPHKGRPSVQARVCACMCVFVWVRACGAMRCVAVAWVRPCVHARARVCGP